MEGVKPGKRQRCVCTTEERMWMKELSQGRDKGVCVQQKKGCGWKGLSQGREKGVCVGQKKGCG